MNAIRSVIALLLIAALLPACYLGRTPSAKRGAYVMNGLVGVAGIAMLAAPDQHECTNPDPSCGAGAAGGALVAGTFLAGALIGTLITLVVPTRREAPSHALPLGSPAVGTTPREPATARAGM